MHGWLRRGGRALAWVFVGVWLAALAACGGGGGAAEPVEPAPTTVEHTGQVRLLGTQGEAVPAAAGVPVSLVLVATDGSVRETLVQGLTDAEGRFRLVVPAASAGRPDLQLRAEPPNRLSLRATAFDAQGDVTPGTEAAVWQWLAVASAAGRFPTEPVARLARWQRVMARFLDLMDLHATADEAAQQELAGWIGRDPASQEALQALRTGGRLSATLGDIGALQGLGRVAGQTRGAMGELNRYGITWNPAAGVFEVRSSALTSCENDWVCGEPATTLRLADDAVVLASSVQPYVGPAFDGLIGPIPLSRIGGATGVEETLLRRESPMVDVVEDSDALPENFVFESRYRVVGVERLTIEGRSVRALRTQAVDDLEVRLSAGGTVRSVRETTSWLLPFTGSVRADVMVRVTDAAGRVQQIPSQATLVRAVVNGMAWPSRLHVDSRRAPIDRLDGTIRPVMLHPDGHLVYSHGGFGDGSEGLRGVDVASGTASARIDFPPMERAAGVQLRPSPDRRHVYVGISRALPDTGVVPNTSQPLAAADADGAMVLRYDGATLQRTLQLTLPARPSTGFPGQGFARREIDNLLASPADGRVWAIAAHGLSVWRDGSRLPGVVEDPGAELLQAEYGVLLTGESQLLGWDTWSGQVAVNFNSMARTPLLPRGRYGLPVTATGLDAASAVGMPTFDCCMWSRTGAEHFEANRIFFASYGVAADRTTGQVLPWSPPRSGSGQPLSTCHALAGDLWCVDDDRLARFDLAAGARRSTLDPDWYLQRFNGSPGLASIPMLLQPLGPGTWVAASTAKAEGTPFLPYVVLRTWPER